MTFDEIEADLDSAIAQIQCALSDALDNQDGSELEEIVDQGITSIVSITQRVKASIDSAGMKEA